MLWQLAPKFQWLPWHTKRWDPDFKMDAHFSGWLWWQFHWWSSRVREMVTGTLTPYNARRRAATVTTKQWQEAIPLLQQIGYAVLLDQDGDDKLWSITVVGGWRRMLLLEVHNTTVSPDGMRETYFIMVDSLLRPITPVRRSYDTVSGIRLSGEPQEYTVRNAIASTFGMTGEEYDVGAAS